MAQFTYLGPSAVFNPGSHGPLTMIRLHPSTGGTVEITPTLPATEFHPGDPLGVEITDARCIRHMEADTRFLRTSLGWYERWLPETRLQ